MRQLSKATYKKFFKHLQTNFPLDRQINVKLDLPVTSQLNFEGSKLRGIAMYDDTSATIVVACTDNAIRNLKTLAHEYRHLYQKFTMGWEYGGPSNFKHEVDANVFGSEQSWKWAKIEGYV